MEKRPRDDDGEEEVSSPEVKRLKESLLENLDDESDDNNNNNNNITEQQSTGDLATFMKALEEEITNLPSNELGFLLGASDDELGLPPPVQGGEPAVVGSELWDEPGYDEFGRFGFDEPDDGGVCGGGVGDPDDECYVALDGLFDYSDIVFGSGEVLWRPGSETLPAQ